MLDKSFFNDLSQKLSALLPLAEGLREQMRTNIEQQLKRSFASLDLLSREEFEQQSRALQRAEQRVAELEATLARLDARMTQLESAGTGGTDKL